MSIYSGTQSEREYRSGVDDGRWAAEYVLSNQLGGVISSDLEDALESSRVSLSRRDRTYWLGYLRGYREIVR